MPFSVNDRWEDVKTMKGAGDELIGAQMFVSKHTAKLKMRWKRGKARLRREKYFVGRGARV